MKKLIRLIVACTIKNPDSYYQSAMASRGVDYTKLTHCQISAWKAVCRIIEADLLIESAFNLKVKTELKDVDFSFLDQIKQ
jgi:hypothetical protein